ncbi:SDR family oxidoreductase [Candidatus Peregrinibacteria bacterium]|jgi:NAD(P)-dependent dehydrogenase (short-subunit alcohol dehydrogenase family)|nr:SDR family oxidoreductase [Candidatus Peregrinibacteria bacterium]MBT5468069.1 SDR family oxidoreductase [Candidatus Peregrinibacteria bacterium]MBT7337577.1 SDR family oxidoreductase [Candidatus Peregrinibacteria bacterium]
MDLNNAVIIVTGASRGIGKALVSVLSEAGATVIGCARTESDTIRAVDVSNPEEMDALVKSVIAEHGKLDVLINNAGVIHQYAPLEEISLEDFKQCIDINLNSVFYGMRSALLHMKNNNSGTIINIASMAATVAHPRISAYNASKFGVLGLTQTAAKELDDIYSKVRLYSVSPGGVDTDMRTELLGDEATKSQSPEVIAKVIIDTLTDTLPANNGDNIQVVHGGVSTIAML